MKKYLLVIDDEGNIEIQTLNGVHVAAWDDGTSLAFKIVQAVDEAEDS